jgi:succinate dehydrogenase / fumarate reductase flavoprotein subunit
MRINIIGAGLAGLSAAITLAENGVKSNLISSMQSERAQSVMAEGGINACLNTMGEGDKIEYHSPRTWPCGYR